MFKAVGAFFSNFFKNITADPVSSLKGVVALASAGATCYGMATGVIPVNTLTIGTAATFTANGIHALGTDATTGKTDAIADKAIAAVQMAAAATPTALTIADHYAEIQKQAGQAQAVLSAASEAAAALSVLQVQPAVATASAAPISTVGGYEFHH